MPIMDLDIDSHDIEKVSELIYGTDDGLFALLFGNDMETAVSNIGKLVRLGNNSFGHENIYVDIDENGSIQGLLIAYSGKEKKRMNDGQAFGGVFSLAKRIRLWVLNSLIVSRLINGSIGPDEFYISNVSVSPESRGKGIGTELMDKAQETAKEKGCDTLLLDVAIENDGAKRLYERLGFEIFKTKKLIFGVGPGTYSMRKSM
ncbi:MAG TPA: N-acetyltransferase [Candidatus Methanofastidiosa archaeon]|nr:N-acetyltransferase [Candidatus Methanofastidiosa archaeon]